MAAGRKRDLRSVFDECNLLGGHAEFRRLCFVW